MSFAARFPYLITSIVLLAPGGILRYVPNEYETLFFRYPFLVPSRFLRRLVAKTLGLSLTGEPTKVNNFEWNGGTGPEIPLETLDVAAAVQWQFDNHQGFTQSFINTSQNGPIMRQQSDWIKICNVIKEEDSGSPSSSEPSKLCNSKMLVVFGDADDIVVAQDVSEDLIRMFGGQEHVKFKTVSDGHGFPVTCCEEVIGLISDFWKLESDY